MIKLKGTLEINVESGVIYFHDNKTGRTVLRICSLPRPIPKEYVTSIMHNLDIIHMQNANWTNETDSILRLAKHTLGGNND